MNIKFAICFGLSMFAVANIPAVFAASADVTSTEEAVVDDGAVSNTGDQRQMAPVLVSPTAGEPARAPSQPSAAAGSVARWAFTTMMRDREPMDEIQTLGNDVGAIHFFTELSELKGQTVTHRWQHNGEVLAEIPFDVRGSRWRVWSSKTLLPHMLGIWKVSVIDGSGNVVHEASFEYVAASPVVGQ